MSAVGPAWLLRADMFLVSGNVAAGKDEEKVRLSDRNNRVTCRCRSAFRARTLTRTGVYSERERHVISTQLQFPPISPVRADVIH